MVIYVIEVIELSRGWASNALIQSIFSAGYVIFILGIIVIGDV